MDFKQFEYVLMVAEEKNFSKAAKKLYISQPSLSQFIGRVEANLGVTLFNRNSNPLSLTYEGQLYVETAKKIMLLSNEMTRAFDDVKNLQQGTINIGITPSKANHPLPMILPVYKKQYPNIKIFITEASSPELEQMIINGSVDISIMNLPIVSDQIAYEPIIDERIFIAAPPSQNILPEKQFETIDIHTLKDELFILLYPGMRLRQITDKLFSEAGVKPNVLLETKSIDTSIRITAAGLGYTFAPESTALYSGLENLPKYYVVGNPPLKWTLAVAYKADSYISKAAQAFSEVVKNVYKEVYPTLNC